MTKILGKVGQTTAGEYIPGNTYEYLDVVSYRGSSYLSRISNNDRPIEDIDAWQMNAEKGDPYTDVINDIDELVNYNGLSSSLIVTDELRGGLFYYLKETDESADNGITFEAIGRGGGIWKRVFDIESGLNILWYGALGDGLFDNADIIENVILNASAKIGKIYIPTGVYNIKRTIGGVMNAYKAVLFHNIQIYGDSTLDSVIKVDENITNEISSVIGIDVLNVDFTIKDLSLDGNNKANRGLYLRDTTDSPSHSNFTSVNLSVSNFLITDDNVESSATGIHIYGKFKSVNIHDCMVNNVHSQASTNRVVNGIYIGGYPVTNAVPTYINIHRNEVKNIKRLNTLNFSDQDAINIGFGTNGAKYLYGGYVNIQNNLVINTGGRFIKSQLANSTISNNTLVIEEDFDLSSSVVVTGGIDAQYSGAVIENNVFILKNTVGTNTLAAIIINQREEGNYKAIVRNNTVIGNKVNQFVRITSSYESSNFVIESNNIDWCDRFVLYAGSAPSEVKLDFSSNYIKTLDNSLFTSEETSNNFNLTVQDCYNLGDIKPITDIEAKVLMINNIGFELGLGIDISNGIHVRNYAFISNLLEKDVVVEENEFGTYVSGTNNQIFNVRFSKEGVFKENTSYRLYLRGFNNSGGTRIIIRYTDSSTDTLFFPQGYILGDEPIVVDRVTDGNKTVDYIFGSFGSSGGTFYLYDILLVEGSHFPGWIPAPEDQVSDWNETNPLLLSYIKNKPTSFPPTAHTHPISGIDDLQDELDNKANTDGSNTTGGEWTIENLKNDAVGLYVETYSFDNGMIGIPPTDALGSADGTLLMRDGAPLAIAENINPDWDGYIYRAGTPNSGYPAEVQAGNYLIESKHRFRVHKHDTLDDLVGDVGKVILNPYNAIEHQYFDVNIFETMDSLELDIQSLQLDEITGFAIGRNTYGQRVSVNVSTNAPNVMFTNVQGVSFPNGGNPGVYKFVWDGLWLFDGYSPNEF